MTVKSIVSQTKNARATLRQIEEELADLRRQGVPIGVDAAYVFELESKGFVVDLETGRPIDPLFLEV